MANIFKPLGTVPESPYGFLYVQPPGATNLLICLHGIGERGNGKSDLVKLERNAAAKLGKENKWNRPVIPVSLQYPGERAYHETLHKFILAMQRYFNAPNEIYIMCLSAGARSGNEYLAMLDVNNAKFSSNIKVMGTVLMAGVGDPYLSLKYHISTRLWAVHGEEDPYPKSFSQTLVANFNRRNPPNQAQYIEIPFGGHGPEVWDRVYQSNKTYEWMLKNQ